jgi:3-dehydroshikimate dehydratase
MNYSLCSISFRYELVSFNDLVQMASERGFDGIELWGIHAQSLLRNHPQGISRMLDNMYSRGLRISMVSDYLDLCPASNKPQDVLEQWESRVQLARSFHTDKIRIFAGNQSSATASQRDWELCIRNLHKIAQLASDHGVYVVIETHPNTLTDTLESTLRLLNDVSHERVRINLDFLHLWESGSDLLEAYSSLKAWTVNFHLKNVSSRDRTHLFLPSNVFSPMGNRAGMTALSEGAIDYAPIIEQLEYEGNAYPLAIEWFGEQSLHVLEKELSWLRMRKVVS